MLTTKNCAKCQHPAAIAAALVYWLGRLRECCGALPTRAAMLSSQSAAYCCALVRYRPPARTAPKRRGENQGFPWILDFQVGCARKPHLYLAFLAQCSPFVPAQRIALNGTQPYIGISVSAVNLFPRSATTDGAPDRCRKNGVHTHKPDTKHRDLGSTPKSFPATLRPRSLARSGPFLFRYKQHTY